MLRSGPPWASEMGPFEIIFYSFTFHLLSQGVTCYVLSGFRNSPMIYIHSIYIIIIFLNVNTFKTILWVSIHSQGLKTYISAFYVKEIETRITVHYLTIMTIWLMSWKLQKKYVSGRTFAEYYFVVWRSLLIKIL